MIAAATQNTLADAASFGTQPRLDAAISVRGLTSLVGGKLLHDALSLDVEYGEIMSLVGGSGAGKSVMLRTILGLQRPERGDIRILGENLSRLKGPRKRRLQMRFGVAFQDGALFSTQTVAENIQIPMRAHMNLSKSMMEEVTRLKIALVGLPPEVWQQYPATLSGGMRKRVGLARALALDPELLFLDEPTAGLDPIAAGQFDDLLRHLKDSLRLSVFMVTHDLDSLRATTDRIAVLVEGKLHIGTIDDLRHSSHPWIQEYFGGSRGRAAIHA